ncbi:dnaJ homolog subfamily C member 25 homolog [Tribolium castaneum]|uniref:DnaJ homolog subfamily C member 25 homolog-like Protein n=1 Tax=Tribolium castaneum TaxID=7070 RepID=D6WD32_TRICA|nr:PREDICTED: dnaJ homolog subfamily C member 25 homolog [Tribolium castaneum]EEZ98325.1 DnaJ homolog subfamily C member 25 homolog-like Protein [Tribolium castaneum]|eukprot:XP_971385.1 PREDICTED: dnaJ homolog subfamily C member 25 homolog [Tribolium castaneum]
MIPRTLLCTAIISLAFLEAHSQLLEGIYCGKSNCYDVLGVTRESTKNEIAKSYRKLAKQYHPDLHRDREAKEAAEEQFKIIANAYDILKDDESRSEYDDMLDNPDQLYAHYYRYYKRRMAPKVDVRIVLVVTISVISLIQYYSGWQRYDSAIKYFMTVPKYRNRALEIAKQEGLLPDSKKASKGKTKMPKDIDQIIKKVIEDKMDIKGAYAKPSITDILWIQLIMSPYTIAKYIYWYISWIWRHTILRQPYNDEEKLYIIRKYLKMGQYQFDSQEDEKKEEFLRRELWIRENFDEWFKEEEENAKKQLAESNKYKQYRRYLKNHGVGRMTFDDS